MVYNFRLEKKTIFGTIFFFLNNEKSLLFFFFYVILLVTDYLTVLVTFYPYCDVTLLSHTLGSAGYPGPGIASADTNAERSLLPKPDLTFLQ